MAQIPPRVVENLAVLRRAADGLSELLRLMQGMAGRGDSVLSELMGSQATPTSWTHWPAQDAYDSRKGYRWYYHCHAREGRLKGEHGHFHLFSDPGRGTSVTHLVAVSVDARGLPLGLFAPNRWVTDERWQPAARVLSLIEGFALSAPRALRRVHAWLTALLRGFGPQVRQLLRDRDRRLAELRRAGRTGIFEDRRVAVLSRYRIDLAQQAAALEFCCKHR